MAVPATRSSRPANASRKVEIIVFLITNSDQLGGGQFIEKRCHQYKGETAYLAKMPDRNKALQPGIQVRVSQAASTVMRRGCTSGSFGIETSRMPLALLAAMPSASAVSGSEKRR